MAKGLPLIRRGARPGEVVTLSVVVPGEARLGARREATLVGGTQAVVRREVEPQVGREVRLGDQGALLEVREVRTVVEVVEVVAVVVHPHPLLPHRTLKVRVGDCLTMSRF